VIVRLLVILSMLMVEIGTARAQSGGSMDKPPPLRIVGLYSLSADKAAYARFIREQIDSRDPVNFPEERKALFRRLGRGDSLQPFTDEDRQEREDHLRLYMEEAAVFEVMVNNPDATFNIGSFIQPDPSQPKSQWQVAWNVKFLTLDGEAELKPDLDKKLPDAAQFRVVFVIHYWKPTLPLRSSYGELALPSSIQPLPERLWRLAPYELPD